ncbi:hypothetical protein KP509_24G044500 [Ceratopteris richardii]|uniref:Dehydroascorbate reductase n=1 Tax=Ceratopteris richardii TaxID=49495 RepID=A0A8T2RX88_CERRI|nr:hypothetical protein KP509_24G044500 [Ceratopteris richardii]
MINIITPSSVPSSIAGSEHHKISIPSTIFRSWPAFRIHSSSLFELSRSSFPSLVQRQTLSLCHPHRLSAFRMAATAVEPIEILVKGATGKPDVLGDCPFCHRVLLTLEEKNVPYELKLVDLSNKPDWFLEINPEGKVPVMKYEGKWIPDSDVITVILEEEFPEPSLKTPPENASVASKIFPCFVKFLKSKDPSDGTEEALLTELKSLNDHLQHSGPYVAGDKITAADFSLAPKLLHLKVALAHFKNWSIPSDLIYVIDYVETLHARESFVKTRAADEYIISGWLRHMS